MHWYNPLAHWTVSDETVTGHTDPTRTSGGNPTIALSVTLGISRSKRCRGILWPR